MSKKSARQKNTNVNINTVQYVVVLIILGWIISWYTGFINQENYSLYISLLVVILLASITLSYKVKKLLKIIWLTISILVILLLYVIYRFNSNGFGLY